jgi:DNA-binding transcriptional ArsR family regulator
MVSSVTPFKFLQLESIRLIHRLLLWRSGGLGEDFNCPLTNLCSPIIVNHMVNYFTSTLDLTFGALAHPIRRGILARLAQGAAPIKEIAHPFNISLPGILKHIGILEEAGLVATSKEGRVKTCQLNAAPIQEAAEWLAFYEQFWNQQFDALADYLEVTHDPATP